MIRKVNINWHVINHRRAVQNRLFKWFDCKKRDLPWLIKKTPYRIWVSEIMLQQTRIVTVVDYYRRFIKRFPNVRQLAAADVDEVLKLWEGLGYYRRARQMHEAARQIVEEFDGQFPERFDDVVSLPGIGRYTAAAILSISLDQRLPILEGNTIRLFARLMMLRQDTTKTDSQKLLWQFSEALLPRERVGDFNQALMDFGREVCRPREPECENCPLASFCPALIQRVQTKIPFRGNKIEFVKLHEAIVLVERKQKILMRKCGPEERWAGLWDFLRLSRRPGDSIFDISDLVQVQTGLQTEIESLDKTIKHAVTKYRIQLDCFRTKSVAKRLKRGSGFQWKSYAEISELPLSSTGRKFANLFVPTG